MLKKWLYPLYVALAIGIVCLCLVFFSDKTDNDSYAESMSLNISREMTITYGETYTLPNNFIIIKPESAKHLLSYTVTNHAGESVNLNFDGTRFEAIALGYYYINFSIPGKAETLTDTLKIHIVEPEDDYISASQKLTTLTVNEVYALTDIVNLTCPDSAEIVVTLSNNNVFYYDLTEKLLVKSSGNVTLTIDISYKAKQQRFTFTFILVDPTPEPDDSDTSPEDNESSNPPVDDNPTDSDNNEDGTSATVISIENITDTINISLGNTAEIIYKISNPDEEISQQVIVEFEDNICSVVLNLSPYIIIQATAIGNTTVTITSLADPSASITLNIVVI